ncbi:MAG: DUF2938 family protein [Paracoccaceae bacterium]|nr:DUF2938 family protein [Paracoccaceae bacterium]
MSVGLIIIVGTLACVILDLWQRFLLFFFKVPPSNWAVVGRWLVYFLKSGRWVQSGIIKQDPIRNELYIGWAFHYFIAFIYALFYFYLYKQGAIAFGLKEGLVFGFISVIVPWFFFMPAMGAGLLGNKTPNPTFTCFLALGAHGIFGGALGLFFKLFY